MAWVVICKTFVENTFADSKQSTPETILIIEIAVVNKYVELAFGLDEAAYYWFFNVASSVCFLPACLQADRKKMQKLPRLA